MEVGRTAGLDCLVWLLDGSWVRPVGSEYQRMIMGMEIERTSHALELWRARRILVQRVRRFELKLQL